MPHAYMQYETDYAVYRWEGNEYIKLGLIHEAGWQSSMFVSIWDFPNGCLSIPVTLLAFQDWCDQYEHDLGE